MRNLKRSAPRRPFLSGPAVFANLLSREIGGAKHPSFGPSCLDVQAVALSPLVASFLSWFGVVFLTPTLPEVGGHFKFQLNLGHPRQIRAMDTCTREQRRRIMQAVKSRDTAPEMLVRQLLHSMGYRYRLHRKDLPGRPDVALLSRRKAIFVHGCFWHGHVCPKGRLPKSRLDYWEPKLAENRERDRKKEEQLRSLGWSVLVIWECERDNV